MLVAGLQLKNPPFLLSNRETAFVAALLKFVMPPAMTLLILARTLSWDSLAKD